MLCDKCENKKWCEKKVTCDTLTGCTSGEPSLLPSVFARRLSFYVKQARDILGIDPKTYLNEVVSETISIIQDKGE